MKQVIQSLSVLLTLVFFITHGESMPIPVPVPVPLSIVKPPPSPEPVNCTANGGSVPRLIFNSRYTIQPDGQICCPFDTYEEESNMEYCLPEDRVKEHCDKEGRGLVYEPCVQCKTCAQKLGEPCGGPQGSEGRCDEGLECFGKDENGTGICTTKGGPRTSAIGEKCGGALDSFGVCAQGLNCTAADEAIEGVCVMKAKKQGFDKECGGIYGSLGRCKDGLRCTVDESIFLSGGTSDIAGKCYRKKDGFCFKDCASPGRAVNYVCGSDNKWYSKICYLRQVNCPRNVPKVVKVDDTSGCGPLPTTPMPTTVTTPPATPSSSKDTPTNISTSQAMEGQDTLVDQMK